MNLRRLLIRQRFSCLASVAGALFFAACSESNDVETDGAPGAPATLTSADGRATATLTLASSWAGGYCANVRVTNRGTTPTTSWKVTIALGSASLVNAWSANVTGRTGNITATPVSYNQTIAPGAGIDIGFCANGSAQPSVLSVTTEAAGGGPGGTGGTGGTTGGTGGATGGTGGTTPTDSRAFFREFANRSAPAFVSGGTAPPTLTGGAVTVNVSPRTVLRTIPRTLFGNNAGVWHGSKLTSPLMEQRLKAVNVSILRFPGGSTSDTYHFDGVYPPHAVAQGWNTFSGDWAVSTAEYMGVVKKLGSIPLITVNHGYATYDKTKTDGKASNAARLAADWVEYCNTPNDGRNPNGGTNWAAKRAADGYPAPFGVRYWEVGNEVYGSWESGYDPVGTTYAKNFNVIADAMKAVDPTIAIGLVVHVDRQDAPWTKAVLSNPGTADRADFLIVHDYFAFPRTAADLAATNWMAKATQVGERKAWLDALVAANTRRAPGSLPYYLGEFNIGIGNLPPQLSLTSGLFISKVLGELTRTGWAAASLWDITHGYGASPVGGHGSHGFLAADQPGVPDLTPRPSYYAFYFFTRNFGDRMVKASSGDPSLQIYASAWSNGKVGAVLVNEAAQAKKVRFAFADGFRPSGPANVWVLSAPSLDSEAVKLNGIGNGFVSGGPPPESVRPYALNPTDGSVSLDVPANSVASIVVY